MDAYRRSLGLEVVLNGRSVTPTARETTQVAVVEEDPMSKEVANRNASAIQGLMMQVQGVKGG